MWLSSDGDNQWKATLIKDPLSCYLAVVVAILVVKAIMRKKTPVDLILIPFVGIVAAMLYSFLLAEWVHFFTVGIGELVRFFFHKVPFLTCLAVSVLVGMALTAPISSVAICLAIIIGSEPYAAAAALIGCCTQMVGFAVHTARDNKWGSVLAVGLGTSMLQFKNIIRKPIVWLPTIIASAILGPFAQLFPLGNLVKGTYETALSVSAGMGTSGLVGPLNLFGVVGWNSWETWLLVIFVCIIGPIVIVFFLGLGRPDDELLRRDFGFVGGDELIYLRYSSRFLGGGSGFRRGVGFRFLLKRDIGDEIVYDLVVFIRVKHIPGQSGHRKNAGIDRGHCVKQRCHRSRGN